MLVVENPGCVMRLAQRFPSFLKVERWVSWSVLLGVVREQRQIQYQRDPISVDQEERGQESVDAGFGHDVGVESVTQIDRVDVITARCGIRLCVGGIRRAENHTIPDRCT